MASLDRLDILNVGTLPPHPGGAAVVGAQFLQRLAARGHGVRALAPISPTHPAPADLAANLSGVRVTWFPVPRFDDAPDVPPDDDFARAERTQIMAKLPSMIRPTRPDVVVAGRESFVRHIPAVARAYQVPCLMLVHGDPTRVLIEGTYPQHPTRRACWPLRAAG